MKTVVVAILGLLAFLSCQMKIDAGSCTEELAEDELKEYLQPNDIGRNRMYDDLNHDNDKLCTRNCTKFPESRICYYVFTVEEYATMSAECGECSANNTADCRRKGCIEADGIERMVIAINRMIPGPTIDVCYGDRIVVDVVNKLATSAVTIHWHGMLQKDTPWMDGVPFVTQCPINANSEFRYDFPAHTSGSLFYHSHMAHLHANGLYGALIVRVPDAKFYPLNRPDIYDVPSHTVIVSDWTHYPEEAFSPGYYRNASHYPRRPDVHLINGRGSYEDSKTITKVAPAEFHLQCGRKYIFRIIASTTSTCSVKVGVHNHSMEVVALDGYPCKSFNVRTLVMSSGQRTDVVLTPAPGIPCTNTTFVMVVKGMDGCADSTKPQIAHLIYDYNLNLPTPPSDLSEVYDRTPYMNNHQLSCTFSNNTCADTKEAADGVEFHKGFVTDQTQSVATNRTYFFIIKPKFYDFKPHLDEGYDSPFFLPGGPSGIFAALLNNVSGQVPPVPLLTQEKDIPKNFPICHGNCSDINEPFCRCLNILEVELNSSVRIRFEGSRQRRTVHPIHLHGHHFQIIDSSPLPTPVSILNQKIRRDVVHAPLDGAAEIMFLADNPGYWIMHCHFSPHFDGGMFLIFKVGNSSTLKPPPPGFPKCGNFKPPINGPCPCDTPKSNVIGS